MAWIAVLAITGFVAGALLWLGLHGRRLDDHPWCRRCRYDLVGLAEALATCPECGRDLTRRRAVRRGRRRRRPVVAAIGGLFLALAASMAGATWLLTALGTDWHSRMPVWALLLEAEWGDDLSTHAALREVLSRQRDGKLSQDELAEAINRALAIQADTTKAWHPAWGAIVEAAAEAKMLTREQWDRYARNAAAFDLVIQSPVRQGDPLLRKLVMVSRVGPDRRFEVTATHEACSIDGRPVSDPNLAYEVEATACTTVRPPARERPREWNVTPVQRYGAFPDRTRHDLSRAEVTLAPGTHRFECRWRFSVHEVARADPMRGWRPFRTGGPPSSGTTDIAANGEPDAKSEDDDETRPPDTWTVRYLADFVVLPPEAETVELVHDRSLRDQIRESIIVRRCTVRRLSQGDWLSGIVEFDDPPVACAFDVYYQLGERRWLLGSVCSGRLGPYGGFQPTICRLREFVMPPGTSRVDVVLVPSRDVAAQSFGTVRIWGEPVVFEGVAVSWYDGAGAAVVPRRSD